MSAEPGNVFQKRFTNGFENMAGAIEEALEFLANSGVGAKAVNVTHLAMEEMATNILKYGYDDTATHEILLSLQIEPGTLRVVLEDDGHEFNPLDAPKPDLDLPMEQRKPGGLGIHLVRQLANHIHYQRCEGRNRLTITIAS